MKSYWSSEKMVKKPISLLSKKQNIGLFYKLGDLERLGRFWMSGTCKPNEQEKRASEPLSIAQVIIGDEVK